MFSQKPEAVAGEQRLNRRRRNLLVPDRPRPRRRHLGDPGWYSAVLHPGAHPAERLGVSANEPRVGRTAENLAEREMVLREFCQIIPSGSEAIRSTCVTPDSIVTRIKYEIRRRAICDCTA